MKILYATRLFSGLEKSFEHKVWKPTGVPTIYKVIEEFDSNHNVKFILTTHYLTICKKFKQSNIIQNYKMVVNVNPDGSFEYTYKIKKGISKMKGGVRVLKDLNYPDHIIKTIENID